MIGDKLGGLDAFWCKTRLLKESVAVNLYGSHSNSIMMISGKY